MQQLVILLLISCSSIYFGCLYAHPQEVRLRFHCVYLSVLLWLLWCWRVGCQPTLQHHNSYNRTEKHRQWNAVWPPDDGRKDARNMLRNNWLTIKSLIVASSWSHIYLLVKDALSLEHKMQINVPTFRGVECKWLTHGPITPTIYLWPLNTYLTKILAQIRNNRNAFA